MKMAVMSMPPMTKEAARSLQEDIKETDKELERILNTLRGSSFKDKMNQPLESKVTYKLEAGDDISDLLVGVKKEQ